MICYLEQQYGVGYSIGYILRLYCVGSIEANLLEKDRDSGLTLLKKNMVQSCMPSRAIKRGNVGMQKLL